jgi:hypothetical protein
MAEISPGSIRTFDGQVMNEDGDVVGRTRLVYRVEGCRVNEDGTTVIYAVTPLNIVFMPLLKEEET